MSNPIGRLWIRIAEGYNLADASPSARRSLFCALSLEGQQRKYEQRTELSEMVDAPTWSDEFIFDVYTNKAFIQVTVFERDSTNKDNIIGSVVLPIFPDLESEEMVDKYIKVQKKGKDRSTGDLKVIAHYNITPSLDELKISQYMKLGQHFVRNIPLSSSILSSAMERKDDVSKQFVRLFYEHDMLNGLIEDLYKKETAQSNREVNIFRIDSTAMKFSSNMCQFIGIPYLQSILAIPVGMVGREGGRMEIDPAKIKNSSELPRNVETFKRVTQMFIDTIINSLPLIPSAIREAGFIIIKEITPKFPSAKRTSMIYHFFLRFLCPCLANARKLDLVDEVYLTDLTERTLVSMAKVIQNLVSGDRFGQKESHLVPLNELVLSNQHRVNAFLDNLPIDPLTSSQTKKGYSSEAEKNIARLISEDVRIVHKYIVSNIASLSVSRVIGVDIRPAGKDLAKLLDILPMPPGFRDLSRYLTNFTQYKENFVIRPPTSPEPVKKATSITSLLSQLEDETNRPPNRSSQQKPSDRNPIDHDLNYLLSEMESNVSLTKRRETPVQPQTPPNYQTSGTRSTPTYQSNFNQYSPTNMEKTSPSSPPLTTKPFSPTQAYDTQTKSYAAPQPKQTQFEFDSHQSQGTSELDSIIQELEQGSERGFHSKRRPANPASEKSPNRRVYDAAYFESLPEPSSDDKVCVGCDKLVTDDSSYIIACQRRWHVAHFKCSCCGTDLAGVVFYEKFKRLFCERDYSELFSPKCGSCQKPLTGKYMQVGDLSFHPECFRCDFCRKPFGTEPYVQKGQNMICSPCYLSAAPKCGYCNQPVVGKFLSALNRVWHVDHFICCVCHLPIAAGEGFRQHEGNPLCEKCRP